MQAVAEDPRKRLLGREEFQPAITFDKDSDATAGKVFAAVAQKAKSSENISALSEQNVGAMGQSKSTPDIGESLHESQSSLSDSSKPHIHSLDDSSSYSSSFFTPRDPPPAAFRGNNRNKYKITLSGKDFKILKRFHFEFCFGARIAGGAVVYRSRASRVAPHHPPRGR